MKVKHSLFALAFMLTIPSAASQTPLASESFRNVLDFFKGLLTGTADTSNAYFIALLLYFIILLAVFMEGVRMIPVFGQAGDVNKQGKVFAVAAALLSTIALFVFDQKGVTSAERMQSLILPFGIWAGVVIAGLIALVTYRLISSIELLNGNRVLSGTIAVTIGMMVAGFLLAQGSLVGWGFLFMVVALIIAIVYGFSSGGEGGNDRDDDRGGDRDRGAQRERQRLLNPARGFVLRAEQAAERLRDDELLEQTADAVRAAVHSAQRIEENLHNARRSIRHARGRQRGSRRTFLNNLYTTTQATIQYHDDRVRGQIPPHTSANWAGQVRTLKGHVSTLIGHCGHLMTEIDRFIDEGREDGGRRPPGPYGSRRTTP